MALDTAGYCLIGVATADVFSFLSSEWVDLKYFGLIAGMHIFVVTNIGSWLGQAGALIGWRMSPSLVSQDTVLDSMLSFAALEII